MNHKRDTKFIPAFDVWHCASVHSLSHPFSPLPFPNSDPLRTGLTTPEPKPLPVPLYKPSNSPRTPSTNFVTPSISAARSSTFPANAATSSNFLRRFASAIISWTRNFCSSSTISLSRKDFSSTSSSLIRAEFWDVKDVTLSAEEEFWRTWFEVGWLRTAREERGLAVLWRSGF